MNRFFLPLLLGLSSAAYAATPNSAQQKPEMSAHEGMHAAMVSMCEGMDSMSMTGSIDHDFLLMMIPHHQSALDMAKAYLKEGVDPEIRETAKKIIEAQEKEIGEMQSWLDTNPADGRHPHP